MSSNTTRLRFFRMLYWAAMQIPAMVIIIEKASAVQKCSPPTGIGGKPVRKNADSPFDQARMVSGIRMNIIPTTK